MESGIPRSGDANGERAALTEHEAFGPAASDALREVWPVLEASADRFTERFHAGLSARPGPDAVIMRLSPDEASRLRDNQAAHLGRLVHPDLDETEALDRARRLGRVHSMVGVEMHWYAAALCDFQLDVLEVLGSRAGRADGPLQRIISRRVSHDLQGTLLGYRDTVAGHARAMMGISRVVTEADTIADLARGVLEALTGLEGFVAGFFGRPDADGRFQFEVGAGEGVEAFIADATGETTVPITVVPQEPGGRGPTGRAWHTRVIERSDAYLLDPTTAPWHENGRRFNWRASAAVPLVDGQGDPHAVLNLYAAWPGYFSHSDRLALLTQVKQIMEPALVRLETLGEGSGVSPYSARAASLAGLAAGDVTMVYQPIVSLPDGRLLKLEALARLRSGGELVPPARFLPAMGDRELMRLFEVGLDQALSALARWEEESALRTGVSVNLPTTCFSDTRYVALVEQALARHGTAASQLTLELLETGYAHDEPRWHGQILDQLNALGVLLAQDDLGSGHSSLLRMQSIAFDEVKIDQRLVRGAGRSGEGLNFIRPLTGLAHSMGLDVVVEGLETRGLVEAAVMLGADAGQGYAIARPLDEAAVPGWARAFRLGIDPDSPETALGGLAGHVAWEHRLAAVRLSTLLAQGAARDTCLLSGYIARLGSAGGELEEAHDALHSAAVARSSGPAYRAAWQRLSAALMRDGEAPSG